MLENDILPSTVSIYNPLKWDVELEWYNDNDEIVPIVLNSLTTTRIPYIQKNFVVRRLSDMVLMERGYNGRAYDDLIKEVEEEILVEDL